MTEKITLLLDYINKSGIQSKKEMDITINTPLLQDKGTAGMGVSRMTYKMSFSLKIPDHIHAGLLGQTVPVGGIGRANETKTYSKDRFTKTINSDSIEAITSRWWEILMHYRWVLNVSKKTYNRVIFYGFNSLSRDSKSTWDGKVLGKTNELKFEYLIGYILEGDDKFRYNRDKKALLTSHEPEIFKLKWVNWTQEREDFFNRMQDGFKNMVDKFNLFTESFGESTIDELIQSPNQLLLK